MEIDSLKAQLTSMIFEYKSLEEGRKEDFPPTFVLLNCSLASWQMIGPVHIAASYCSGHIKLRVIIYDFCHTNKDLQTCSA